MKKITLSVLIICSGLLLTSCGGKKVEVLKPVACFTSDKSAASNNEPINFDPSCSQNATSWEWDFGDGTKTTQEKPVNSWTLAGTYTVKLKVYNSDKSLSAETSKDYVIDDDTMNQKPYACFKILTTPVIGFYNIGDDISISANCGDYGASWEWSFGDGGTATGQNVTHRWNSATGNSITLVVWNGNHTKSDTRTQSINLH